MVRLVMTARSFRFAPRRSASRVRCGRRATPAIARSDSIASEMLTSARSLRRCSLQPTDSSSTSCRQPIRTRFERFVVVARNHRPPLQHDRIPT